MADYLPQLMELDSYWEKAIEDGIRDAVKGKKRLLQALVTRDKLSKKIKKLIMSTNSLKNCQREILNKKNKAECRGSRLRLKKRRTTAAMCKRSGNKITTKNAKSRKALGPCINRTKKNSRMKMKTKKKVKCKKRANPLPIFKERPNLNFFDKMKKSRNNFIEPMESPACSQHFKKNKCSNVLSRCFAEELERIHKTKQKEKENLLKRIKTERSRLHCGGSVKSDMKNKKALKKERGSSKHGNDPIEKISVLNDKRSRSRCRCRK